MTDANEPRRSPAPRFSDEAYSAMAARFAEAAEHYLGTTPTARQANGIVSETFGDNRVVEAEFDAACASAWRDGRRELAERLRERAATTTRLCRDNAEHDDRYCSMCSNVADGLDLAADLIEQWTTDDGKDGSE